MLEWVYEILVGSWTQPFFQKAVVGGCLVAIPAAVVGCLIVLRRMAFLGDALSHAMLAGVCAGYLVMKLAFGFEADTSAMLVGAILAAVVTIALIGFVSNFSRIKEDTAIGIMYTGIFALGVVLVSLFKDQIHVDIYHFIVGDILGIGDADLWLSAVVGAIVLTGVILLYRHLQIAAFDRVMAATIGLPVVLLDYALTTGASLVVVTGVRIVGMIMVVGLLISPAASAYLLCRHLWSMMTVAAIFGVTSIIGGLYLARAIGASAGGSIVVFTTLQFLAVMVVAPRHGLLARWYRLRNRLPQEAVEDVLSGVLRADGDGAVPSAAIRAQSGVEGARLQRVLGSLERDGLLRAEDAGWSLTEAGRLEAVRLRRSHRLWETYLNRLGVPGEELHERAHRLEHIHDQDALAYIDDLLGHPERDPHGSEIPEAPYDDPDQPRPVSLLRSGQSGEIALLGPAARHLDLALGERVALAPRDDDTAIWTLIREDGSASRLDHDQADAVLVQRDRL